MGRDWHPVTGRYDGCKINGAVTQVAPAPNDDANNGDRTGELRVAVLYDPRWTLAEQRWLIGYGPATGDLPNPQLPELQQVHASTSTSWWLTITGTPAHLDPTNSTWTTGRTGRPGAEQHARGLLAELWADWLTTSHYAELAPWVQEQQDAQALHRITTRLHDIDQRLHDLLKYRNRLIGERRSTLWELDRELGALL